MPPLNTPGQQIRYQPSGGANPPQPTRQSFVAGPGVIPGGAQPQAVSGGGQFGARPQLQANRKRRRFADRIVLPEVVVEYSRLV